LLKGNKLGFFLFSRIARLSLNRFLLFRHGSLKGFTNKGSDIQVRVTSDNDWTLNVDDHAFEISRCSCFHSSLDIIGHEATMTERLIILMGRLVSVGALIPAMDVAGSTPWELAMVIDKRYAIRPDMVFFKVPGDMDFLERILDVLGQHVLSVCLTINKLLLEGNKLVLHILKVVESLMTTKLELLEVIKGVDSVVKQAHNVVFVLDWVLLEVLLAPGHVVDGGVEHFGHGCDDITMAVVNRTCLHFMKSMRCVVRLRVVSFQFTGVVRLHMMS